MPVPDPEIDPVYHIPVVVHVLHRGEPIGEGYNLSVERITRQIDILNEDYRRKEGTRGFNNHPDGGDALIEFKLASAGPEGNKTNGINRINIEGLENPRAPNDRWSYWAWYGYWNPEYYLNIWIEPWDESTIDLVLGAATGPKTDLPGADLFEPGEPDRAEGVIINHFHFGESDIDSDYNLGRTLTHEIGHYLGLLHPWGTGECETNDFCDDTPPVTSQSTGCHQQIGCDGEPVMVENFMDYSPDACMRIFTNDQIERMHYVLKNSPRRKTLNDSPGL